MNVSRLMKTAALCVIALAMVATAPDVQAQYTFKVINQTKLTIVSLLASENGEEASEFDIGNGIRPGRSMMLEWDRSTERSSCDWAFSAVYDDGTYSEPVMIDFCEDNLELVFRP